MYSIGVVGGRDFRDSKLLEDEVMAVVNFIRRNLSKDIRIVSGGARGADSLAEHFAKKQGLYFVAYTPDIQDIGTYGFAEAARIRNQKIVDLSDEIVAFPTDNSRGTWDTIKRARDKKIPCKVIKT